MPEITHCSECGSALPDYWPKGLCPQCALDGALDEPTAATPQLILIAASCVYLVVMVVTAV